MLYSRACTIKWWGLIMLLLQQMIVLYIIMLVGYLCRKLNLLDDHSSKKISGLVVNIANPALILSSSINQESTIKGLYLEYTFLLAILIFTIMILLSYIIPKLLHTKKEEYGTYRVMTVFSNIGFMGFPVIAAVYGSEALLYASIYLIPYNVLIYTWGIRIMTASKQEGSSLKRMINIGVVACLISIAIYLLGIPMPKFVESSVSMLSNLTAPLSMIVIGNSLALIKWKSLFMNFKLVIFSIIKLLLLPIIGVLLLRTIGLNSMLLGVCMIMLATPVGSMTVMLAQQYEGDYELASQGVMLTTILAVITMPIVSMLVG